MATSAVRTGKPPQGTTPSTTSTKVTPGAVRETLATKGGSLWFKPPVSPGRRSPEQLITGYVAELASHHKPRRRLAT